MTNDFSILTDFLVNELRNEFLDQGHDVNGSLLNSIEVNAKEIVAGWQITGTANFYAKYVDRGRQIGAKGVPISALIKWIQARGIESNSEKAKGIAFAMQNTIKKEGIPTKGSYAYTQNGRRKQFITYVLENNNEKIREMISDVMYEIVYLKIKNFVAL